MPRTCTICSNPKRIEIEAALIHSEPLRTIATRFDTSTGALQRHKDIHIPAKLARAKEENEIKAASALVKELRELTKKTGEVLARALRQKNGDLALKAIARLEKQLELKGRLLGELEDRGGRGDTTKIEVVYIDARKRDPLDHMAEIGAGTQSFHHSLEASKSNALETNDVNTSDHLLADQI